MKNLTARACCILAASLQFFISLAKLHVLKRGAQPQRADLPLTKLGSVSSICLMSHAKVLTCLETHLSLYVFPSRAEESSHKWGKKTRNGWINREIAQPWVNINLVNSQLSAKTRFTGQGSTKAATIFDRHQHVLAQALNHSPALLFCWAQRITRGTVKGLSHPSHSRGGFPGFKDIWGFG